MDHISSARNGGEKSIAILRGKVPAIRLYEIEERELDMLEKGMPASLFLNFGIALVSISCSFLIALLATHIASDRIFYCIHRDCHHRFHRRSRIDEFVVSLSAVNRRIG